MCVGAKKEDHRRVPIQREVRPEAAAAAERNYGQIYRQASIGQEDVYLTGVRQQRFQQHGQAVHLNFDIYTLFDKQNQDGSSQRLKEKLEKAHNHKN